MIMSCNTSNHFSRLSQLMVCSSILLIVPFGLVQAQDYKKVEKRLHKSVEKGQLTEEQAEAMMETLKRMSKKQEDRDESELRLRDIDREIRAAIEAGKMTKEEGRAKMNAIRKRIGKHKAAQPEVRSDEEAIEGMIRRVEHAAKSGRTTREETTKALKRLKNRLTHEKLEKASQETLLAAEKGEISQEHAERRLAGIRERMAAVHGNAKDPMEGIARRLKMAVESGDISKEEATKKWIGIQLRKAEEKVGKAIEQGEISEEDARLRMNEYRRKLEVEHRERNNSDDQLEEIARRLKMAVRNGDMTEDEAHAKWEAIQDRNRDGDKLRQLELKIKHAVAEGELTKEEAREKFEAIRRKFQRHDEDGPHEHHEELHEHHEDDNDKPHEHDGDDDLAVFSFYLGVNR